MKKINPNTNTVHYPHAGDRISRREAIEFVSSLIYPRLNSSDRNKLVRDRMLAAERKGQLKLRRKDDTIDAREFFSWAINGRGWEALGLLSIFR